MEVRDAGPVTGQGDAGLGHLGVLRLLVRVVPHHEAEQQPGHHDITQPQHREVALDQSELSILAHGPMRSQYYRGVRGGEHQLAGEREVGGVARHGPAHAAQRELLGHDTHRVLGWPGRYLHHHVGTEHVLKHDGVNSCSISTLQ